MSFDKTYKVDLHTHSIISHDGGISAVSYKKILASGKLDVVAITDHNTVDFALTLQQEVGEKIIVGEEIMSQDGEIIGLFLHEKIPAGLSIEETVDRIHMQKGLVSIPHPFETIRKGLQEKSLQKIIQEIDIIEVYNARSMQREKTADSYMFARKHNLGMAASSDAHCVLGVGSSYNIITEIPTKNNLKTLLQTGSRIEQGAPVLAFFCPLLNKLKKMLQNKSL